MFKYILKFFRSAIKSNPERIKLQFDQEVLKAFLFLVREYKFRVTLITPTLVKYESTYLIINVYHGRMSYELGIETIRKGDFPESREQGFTLDELVALLGSQEDCYFQVSTQKGVHLFVPKLAALFRKYAEQILKTYDSKIFDKLWEQRLYFRKKFAEEVELRHVREKAQDAWNKKDYLKIVILYNPIKHLLSQVELKKLEYAEKKTKT